MLLGVKNGYFFYLKGFGFFMEIGCVNDPSAGSPTETLLRLLLPLNEQVCLTSQVFNWRTKRKPNP